MSNAKVERHKQEKYNRKKNQLKKKIKDVIVGIAVALLILAVVGVIGYQVFDDYIKYDTIAEIDLTAMAEALGKVQTASTEEETEGAETEGVEVTTEDGHDHEHEHEHEEETSEDTAEEDKSEDKEVEDKEKK